ncbi:eukaryotic translation initiation factor 2D [Nasonia vitripennis]|uniref:SUI1 domain-containing protein n=1 Tax=Nasonia vitripennis TaxID=7425 RepID=A0A7M7LUL9_NASVI|nr:eukaryotic translation initiation factor 2D [Nasonia vitripennis]XP_016837298.1 eukaryotic translation initiation factor 2D [Nasonia vitripennis]XP_032453123.1 eukaryotic translation initiation factor 2D [Nasonia vitripennis]
MFIKAFKVKSNNQLKGTERKKLCDEVAQAFPSLKPEEIQNLLPKKEVVSVLKIITHDGQTGKVYCTAKVPLFFQMYSSPRLFPTIFTLWHHPDLLYTFVTPPPVVSKLANGAHLMLPGVITAESPPNYHSYGKLQKGTPVAVVTDDNKAPVAVGITALSSQDMYMAAGFGKCVEILHVMGDTLYNMDKPPVRPKLGPPVFEKYQPKTFSPEENQNNEPQTTDNEIQEISANIDNVNVTGEKDNENENEDVKDDTESVPLEGSSEDIKEEVLDPVQEMDKLLEYCFLKACKTSLKKGDLPMITSTFFKNHVIGVCPPGKTVDVKKSSYKKLSVFLASLKEKGLVNTSVFKGVESLLAVKYDHPLLKNLVINEEAVAVEEEVSNAPVIDECFRVTAAVIPVLSTFGYKQGDVLKRTEIRRCFTEYVKSKNLHSGKVVKINYQIADILCTKENQIVLTMEDAINKFIGKMTHTHEITVAGNKILRSGKLEPIDITVATRSGNKKVTLINNLETFGIKLEEFSKECQGVGASATITDIPGKKKPSVLVQGNQVIYVYKLLTEKYRIHKNYIRGLEFAPKK